jgi:tRNA A37 threonylcarbamoyladenosine synthetase subunit TsaC/SUA5/YrdC
VIADPKNTADLIVVLKPDRAKALTAALDAAVAAASANAASTPAKTTPPNVAVVRDGTNNSVLGTVTLALGDEGWRGTVLKLNDPKRPFKAFDRLLLSLPNKK